jgi:aarF domain-containing kinase
LFAMTGKRLLDIAALFNASRGVAQKHVALRSRQLDVYNRTSTLARAVRSQTDRVTETVKAASFLASRLNESTSAWASDAADGKPSARSIDEDLTPSKQTTEGDDPVQKPNVGLEQDYVYEHSAENSAADVPPADDLDIQQETADRYSLPDRLIPPREDDLKTLNIDHDAISTRTQDEKLGDPLQSVGLHTASSDASSIPPAKRPLSSNEARTMQRKSELQIPSRSADALGGSAAGPLEEGHGEESFYRKSGHSSPALSSLPTFKIPKHPSDAQKSDAHPPEGAINSDSFYHAVNSSTAEQIPSVEAVPKQEQAPEGINTYLFHSSRVANILGGKLQGSKGSDLQLKGVRGTPIEHTRMAVGTDQDAFNVYNSSQNQPTLSNAILEPQNAASQGSDDVKVAVEELVRDSVNESSHDSVKVRARPRPAPLHTY